MSGEYEDAGVENRSLSQCGAEGPVQAVLEVELPSHSTQWGNRSPKNGRVVGEQAPQVERALRRDELTELDDARRHVGPVLCRDEPVVGIGGVADGLENHPATIGCSGRREPPGPRGPRPRGPVAWLECQT